MATNWIYTIVSILDVTPEMIELSGETSVESMTTSSDGKAVLKFVAGKVPPELEACIVEDIIAEMANPEWGREETAE